MDLPIRGAGQVRPVVGELVTGPWTVVGGRSISLVGPSPGVSPRAARAAEGGAKALPRPRVGLPPSLAQRLGRGDRNLKPPITLHSHHANLGLGAGQPLSLACSKQGQHPGSPGTPDVVPVRSIGLALGEDHARALPHPVPEPATPPRETGSDVLQGRSRNTSGGQPGPPDDCGTSGRETPQAQQSADAVQGPTLAVGMAHTLYRVAGPEGDKVIPRSTLQETLVADLANASEPSSQEGVPSGTQDVDRTFPQAEVPPRPLPRGILLGIGKIA